MSAKEASHKPNVEHQHHHFDRRSLLQVVAASAVGLGLVGGASVAVAEEPDLAKPKEEDLPKSDPMRLRETSKCPELLKVSKFLRARVYLGTCERCACGDDVNFIVPYTIDGFLFSNDVCDETSEIWPNQTKVAAEATMTLRQTKCGNQLHLVGSNEGTIKIYGTNGGVVAELFGTQGFETHASNEKRCCAPDHGEGTWKGHGYEKLEGCRLCVSYVSQFHALNPQDPCEMRSISMTANLDGVLICPCRNPS
jgi:hypothetical protein